MHRIKGLYTNDINHYKTCRIETRLRAIDNLLIVLNKNCIPESVEKWRGTIAEIVLNNLKRTVEEASRVCSLAALLSLQLGLI